jgi:hypothetical protein
MTAFLMTACFFIQKKQLPRTDYQGLTALRYAAGKSPVNTKTQGKFMNQRKEEEREYELVRGGNAVLESAATVLACICGSMLVLFIAILISKL